MDAERRAQLRHKLDNEDYMEDAIDALSGILADEIIRGNRKPLREFLPLEDRLTLGKFKDHKEWCRKSNQKVPEFHLWVATAITSGKL